MFPSGPYIKCIICIKIHSAVACVASVPERRERNLGRAKEVVAFGPRKKMGREQKGGRNGVGEGKEGNACPQTPGFWKTRLPTNGAPDGCGMAILIDKCIIFAWMIPEITRAWLAQYLWTCAWDSLSKNLFCLAWMVLTRFYSEDAIF